MKRKAISEYQSHEKAQPMAEMKYSTPMSCRAPRRPLRSPRIPANNAPTMVPQSALATVKPSARSERWNVSVSARVVPAMTAVSNPNSNPPTVLRTTWESSFIASPRAWAVEAKRILLYQRPGRNQSRRGSGRAWMGRRHTPRSTRAIRQRCEERARIRARRRDRRGCAQPRRAGRRHA